MVLIEVKISFCLNNNPCWREGLFLWQSETKGFLGRLRCRFFHSTIVRLQILNWLVVFLWLSLSSLRWFSLKLAFSSLFKCIPVYKWTHAMSFRNFQTLLSNVISTFIRDIFFLPSFITDNTHRHCLSLMANVYLIWFSYLHIIKCSTLYIKMFYCHDTTDCKESKLLMHMYTLLLNRLAPSIQLWLSLYLSHWLYSSLQRESFSVLRHFWKN